MFVVEQGVPSDEELAWLSRKLDRWKTLARRLGFVDAITDSLEVEYRELSQRIYEMLLVWKRSKGLKATYEVLHHALCHPLVGRKDLAEKFDAYSKLPQFITGNVSLISQFNNSTITYKNKA